MSALRAVVFDWAGTIVDFGSRAPMGAFVEVFRSFDVAISIDEARGPMGLPKWQHIEALMKAPRIAEAFGHTFWWAVGVIVLAVIPALLLPRRRPSLPPGEQEAVTEMPAAEAVAA